MMNIHVRVKTVDHNGYNGRDHHPTDEHIGMEGTVTDIELMSDDFDEDRDLTAVPEALRVGYQVFYVVLDNHDRVELMGHEIELVWATHDGDL